ncbi:hypothetical protein TRFO_35190 [Tritrichomonas foetus]|uniref:Uncharacterized protein n=1 Tax=Tritrichomonas foetus TaxID=1144522 RepID=A0A1J4JGZ3_9EUKA|nr:hypothetical protein TRFO_35190 [Tritrichomonas foetus]|eukprot:OHS98414.1 hypothetical protein TRFO_35190 [Tritrichomonas foetus]
MFRKKESTTPTPQVPFDSSIFSLIQGEARDIIDNRDGKRLTIDQMIQEIEEALSSIGYVDVPPPPRSSDQQDSDSDSSDDIEILD